MTPRPVALSEPCHLAALGQQALTASAMARGRFSLGISLSHKIVIEDSLGLSYARPAKTMREYLEVLNPILNGETAHFEGDLYNVNVTVQVNDATLPVPLLTAGSDPKCWKLLVNSQTARFCG